MSGPLQIEVQLRRQCKALRSDQAGYSFPTMFRKLIHASAVVASVTLLYSTGAGALVSGAVAAGQTTIDPGASTSITADFNEVSAGTQFVSLIVSGGSAGSISIVLGSGSGASANCVQVSQTQVDCQWISANGPTGSVTATATASSDAQGTFQVFTEEFGGSPLATTPVASLDLTVQAPVTTTIAPTTTTISAPVSSAATPTTAPPASAGNSLPATGPDSTGVVAVVASLLLAAGCATVFAARRSQPS